MELKQELGIVTPGEVTSDTVKAQLKRRHLEMWKGKPLHGYLPTKIEKDEKIDDRATAEWMNTGLSSHVEGYTVAFASARNCNTSHHNKKNKRQKPSHKM